MARKPLFTAQNKPVMAVTWPFAELDVLDKVRAVMDAAGYDTYIHTRKDIQVFELIVGNLKTPGRSGRNN